MSEETKTKKDTEEKEAKKATGKPEILLALIEHGSRPIATFLIGMALITWLFLVRVPLFNFLEKSKSLKVGSFEVQLREIVEKANLNPELFTLQELNDQQLQLFLIIGKEREPITYYGEELTEKNLKKLKEVGLLSDVQVKAKQNELGWKVSEKGAKLHNIITNLIITSIRQSALPETKKE